MISDVDDVSLDTILSGFHTSADLPAYLRISLLENCNERCFFCHNEGYDGREEILDETVMWKAVAASVALGKKKFKFTGGEPTEHPLLVPYVEKLRGLVPDADIGLITNATYLARLAQPLRDAGLNTVNVSLHSLEQERYRKITQFDGLRAALDGLTAAKKAGFTGMTINMVVSTINMDEVPAFVQFTNDHGYQLRLLDILETQPALAKVRVAPDALRQRFPDVELKDKLFHDKCKTCSFVPICGEAEYLRLSASGSLDPCMYRADLKQPLLATDTEPIAIKKVALGFRRVWYDNL